MAPVLGSLLLGGCFLEQAQPFEFDVVEGTVDAAMQLPGTWQRLCIFTPYMTNGGARDILGFAYNVTWRSNIALSDSITLLATVNEDRVTGLYEVPMTNFNFAALGAGCIERANAVFSL
jgi:hypothetical protein